MYFSITFSSQVNPSTDKTQLKTFVKDTEVELTSDTEPVESKEPVEHDDMRDFIDDGPVLPPSPISSSE